MRCTRLAANTGRKQSPSRHHRTTLSGHIFATKARIDNRKKNWLSSNTSSICPDNMVNFGPLTAEIGSGVWGAPTNFNGFCVLAALTYCTASSSGRQPNFAALNRGRHLCSAGRPSGWALAHILVKYYVSRIMSLQRKKAKHCRTCCTRVRFCSVIIFADECRGTSALWWLIVHYVHGTHRRHSSVTAPLSMFCAAPAHSVVTIRSLHCVALATQRTA